MESIIELSDMKRFTQRWQVQFYFIYVTGHKQKNTDMENTSWEYGYNLLLGGGGGNC